MNTHTPSITPSEPESFICCATYIPLRSWLYVFPFTWLTKHIEHHLKNRSGFVRSQIRSDINILGPLFETLSPLDNKYFRRRFWTFTVWRDRGSSKKFFADSPHHRKAVQYFKKWTYPTARIVIWKSDSSKIDWNGALQRFSDSNGIKDYYDKVDDDFENYRAGIRLDAYSSGNSLIP